MDADRFDAIAKGLARASTRRAGVKLAAGGALAALLARLGIEGATAACVAAGKGCDKGERCCDGARCKGGKCTCNAGLKDCGQDCRECCTDGDCRSRNCRGGRCRPVPTPPPPPPASCADGIKNGTESDVDCGGPCFRKCSIGKACAGDGDCASGHCCGGVCRACCANDDCPTYVCSGNVCQSATCDDGVRNGDESDVDCGGPCSRKCLDGRRCSVASDCQNGFCNGGNCFPANQPLGAECRSGNSAQCSQAGGTVVCGNNLYDDDGSRNCCREGGGVCTDTRHCCGSNICGDNGQPGDGTLNCCGTVGRPCTTSLGCCGSSSCQNGTCT